MTDQVTTPADPAPVAQQPVTPTVPATTPPVSQGNQPPAGYIEKARFDGLVRKVEELTLANRKLQEDLQGKTSQVEQLSANISLKDTEKSAAVGERDNQIQTLTQASLEKDAELKRLRALELKLQVVNEMNRGDLVPLLSHIPDMEDAEALKATLGTFADFTDTAVRAREQQLTSGVLPVGGGITQADTQPSTREAWNKEINNLPVGSKERNAKVQEFGAWLEASNQVTR